jgi:hypothetical protein
MVIGSNPLVVCGTSKKKGGSMGRRFTMFSGVCSFHEIATNLRFCNLAKATALRPFPSCRNLP